MLDFNMMIGLPASGKSTLVEELVKDYLALVLVDGVFVYSTDTYIEHMAKQFSKTYDQMFLNMIGEATDVMNNRLKLTLASTNNDHIIWDQTNLTVKSRASKFTKFDKFAIEPNRYRKIASVVRPPEEMEWRKRLNSREGKNIPENVIAQMVNSYELPTFDEPFDEIRFYDSFGNKQDTFIR